MNFHNDSHARLNLGASLGILLFALVMASPLITGFFTDHEARKDWEKRPLEDWPELNQDTPLTEYFASLGRFSNDHVGFALPLNQLYRKLKFYLYRDSPLPNIIVGKGPFVFLGSHGIEKPHAIFQSLCQGTPPTLRERKIKHAFVSLLYSTAILDLKFHVGIMPSKPVLYADYLPRTLPKKLRESCASFPIGENFPSHLARSGHGMFFYPLQDFLNIRHQPHFYPPENFHSNGASAHEFSRGFLEFLGIEVSEAFAQGKQLITIPADLQALGFNRDVKAWTYPYSQYEVTRQNGKPAIVREHYKGAGDFAIYRSDKPASDRTALILSNSFGAFIAPHLAPGFRKIYHINLNRLQADEAHPLLESILFSDHFTDFIYLVHDGGLMNAYKLDMISDGLAEAVRKQNSQQKDGL